MKMIFNSVCPLCSGCCWACASQLKHKIYVTRRHNTLCKEETSWLQCSCLRTGSMWRMEGLLSLILEDKSKTFIKDGRVEVCLVVGFLAPAHSILIRFRDGMVCKPNTGNSKSYVIPFTERGRANEAVMVWLFFLLPQEADRSLGDLSFPQWFHLARVVRLTADAPWPIMHCWSPFKVRDKRESLAVKRILMRGEIADLKGFLSALLFLDNNRVYHSPFIPLYRVRHCPLWRALKKLCSLLISLSWLVCQREGTVASAWPGAVFVRGVSGGQDRPCPWKWCQPCGFYILIKWRWEWRKEKK